MEITDAPLNWRHWFDRWQRMQDCYVPERRYRFDLMFRFPRLAHEDPVHVLNLGCGPGSLAFHALECYPRARAVAVDVDPLLLQIGRHVAEQMGRDVQFLQKDIRQADWWKPYEGQFDLVVSATALHWLGADNLLMVYRRVVDVLRPGGWFMNSDHVASDDPLVQERYRALLAARQKAAFAAAGADDWDGFWEQLGRDVGHPELLAGRHAPQYWEGTDDGQPRGFHLAGLHKCGFRPVDTIWQDLGEAVIAARKPP